VSWELRGVQKVVIAQDICFKHLLVKFGGPGYSYILSQIVPRMLLIAYAIPLEALLRTDPPTRLVLSVLYVAAPVIFASVCFAARFKVRPAADLGG